MTSVGYAPAERIEQSLSELNPKAMKPKFIVEDNQSRFVIEISVNKRNSYIMIEVSTDGVYFDAEQCLLDIDSKLGIYGANLVDVGGDIYSVFFINVPSFSLPKTLLKLQEDFGQLVEDNCKIISL